MAQVDTRQKNWRNRKVRREAIYTSSFVGGEEHVRVATHHTNQGLTYKSVEPDRIRSLSQAQLCDTCSLFMHTRVSARFSGEVNNRVVSMQRRGFDALARTAYTATHNEDNPLQPGQVEVIIKDNHRQKFRFEFGQNADGELTLTQVGDQPMDAETPIASPRLAPQITAVFYPLLDYVDTPVCVSYSGHFIRKPGDAETYVRMVAQMLNACSQIPGFTLVSGVKNVFVPEPPEEAPVQIFDSIGEDLVIQERLPLALFSEENDLLAQGDVLVNIDLGNANGVAVDDEKFFITITPLNSSLRAVWPKFEAVVRYAIHRLVDQVFGEDEASMFASDIALGMVRMEDVDEKRQLLRLAPGLGMSRSRVQAIPRENWDDVVSEASSAL